MQRTRRTEAEIADELEAKVSRIRAKLARKEACEKDKRVKGMLATSRALTRYASIVDVQYVSSWLKVATELEREADRLAGQSRVDGAME